MSRDCATLTQTEGEFIRSEFTALRTEIDRRSSEQFLYLSLSVTAAGALAAVALGDKGEAGKEWILLIVPFLSSILGFLWLDHDRTILAIGSYIAEHLWPSDLPSFEREKPRYRGKPSRFVLGFLTPTVLAFLAPAVFSLIWTCSMYREPLWIGGCLFLVVFVIAALRGVWSRHLAR
jgi:hypothetical protein